MDLFVILRRNGFADAEELSDATTRSVRVSNEEMPDEIRWVRAYVLDEGDGGLGTICVYRATDAEAIREHASRAELPIDEILAVSDTILVRPTPSLLSSGPAASLRRATCVHGAAEHGSRRPDVEHGCDQEAREQPPEGRADAAEARA